MENRVPPIQNIMPNTGRFIAEGDTIHNVIEPSANAVRTIDKSCFVVINGQSFTYSSAFSLPSSGGTARLLGKTNGAEVRFDSFALSADAAPVTIRFYEFPTVTAEGTAAIGYNRNRIVGTASQLQIFPAPTISANGDLLFTRKILGTHQTTGSDELSSMWILQPNSYYMFEIVNGSNQVSNLVAGFNWMEC